MNYGKRDVKWLFEEYADKYDEWYDKIENKLLYEAELNALNKLRKHGLAIEIGVGSGRFASKLNIQFGIDLSLKLLLKAKKRGVNVILADASYLPIRNEVFDEAYFIVTICFLTEVDKAIIEARRIIKRNGSLIIAFIPKDSPLGRKYIEKARGGHIFYSRAKFYNLNEILNLTGKFNFKVEKIISTLGPKINDLIEGYNLKYSFCCVKLKRM